MTKEIDGAWLVKDYVVCLLDVLNQKEHLNGWSKIPPDGILTPQFEDAMKKSVGRVQFVREQFEAYFRQFELMQSSAAWLPIYNLSVRQRFRECTLHTQQFSDTVIFYSPLVTKFGDENVESVCRILAACATIMMCALEKHIPLRGAVCIGPGLEFGKNDFYGPALAQAYELESKKAEYPRVVVSSELRDFLRSGLFSKDSDVNQLNVFLAEYCEDLLWDDLDGQIIVDFMGKTFSEIVDEDGKIAPPFQKVVLETRNFVTSEADRFQQSGNEKLALRYRRLHEYIQSRADFWCV